MNTYEMIYCFKPTLDPDSVELSIKNIENTIVNLKGTIIKTDKMGRKKLAYDVAKFRDGFYASTYFELEPEKIKTLKRNMKLNENVIRELTIRIDDMSQYSSLPDDSDQQEGGSQQRHHRSEGRPYRSRERARSRN